MNGYFEAFWFFLPGALANVAPLIANAVPGLKNWNLSLDFGKSYRGKRIFGDNKTWRGLLSGVVVGGIVSGFQSGFYHVLPGDQVLFIFGGMLMGFGALAGDAAESFFKRQFGRKPGQTWFPFDQIDYIVGGLLAVSPFIRWYPGLIIKVFIIYFFIHLITVYIGFKLKIRDAPI